MQTKLSKKVRNIGIGIVAAGTVGTLTSIPPTETKRIEYFTEQGTPVADSMEYAGQSLMDKAFHLFAPAPPQYKCDTLYKNPGATVKITVLAEGYTAAEQDKATADTRKVFDVMFSTYPYSTYKKFFQVILVHSISEQSGVKVKIPNCYPLQDPNNLLGSYYGGMGICRLILVGNNVLMNDILNSNTPGWTLPVVICNSTYYGGGADGSTITLSAGDPQSGQVLIHELGHGLAGLGDEYRCDEAWNIQNNVTDPAQSRWYAMIQKGIAGLFGTTCKTPNDKCLMRTLNTPVCPVCEERMKYSFTFFGDPVISVYPKAGSTSTDTFRIVVNQPADNTIRPVWKLNGVVKSYSWNYRVPAGTYSSVSVDYWDTTSSIVNVKNFPNGTAKKYSKSWTNITVKPPVVVVPVYECKSTFIEAKIVKANSFRINWSAVDGAISYKVERKLSTALKWIDAGTYGPTVLTKLFGNLQVGKKYSIRVTVLCKNGDLKSTDIFVQL